MSNPNVHKSVHKWHENGPRRDFRGPFSLVALERFWSNSASPERNNATRVTGEQQGVSAPAPQRRRITARLRADVVEHYERGMSTRRVAATLGLGRTTVLEILKTAGVEMRPHGRKY
jgi:Homeodomain-like domain